MSTLTIRNSLRRPGGRTADVTQRVHSAVFELLVAGGADGCTFKAVAERAGVERSTLYRRYPDRWVMMIDAFVALAAADVTADPAGSFRAELGSVLRKLATVLDSPLGSALMIVAAELHGNSGIDVWQTYFRHRLEQLAPMFDGAVGRGELSPTVDRETLITLAAGPIYFRIFISGRPVDDVLIDAILDSVCGSFCRRPPPKVPRSAFPL